MGGIKEAASPSRELEVHGSRGQGLAKRTLAAKSFIQGPDPGGKQSKAEGETWTCLPLGQNVSSP